MSRQNKHARSRASFCNAENCRMSSKVKRIACNVALPYEDQSFSWLIDYWRRETWIKQKASTIQKYNFLIKRHIIPALGNHMLRELTPEILNEFVSQKLRQGRLDGCGKLSPAYVHSMAIIINTALAFANEELALPLQPITHKPHLEKKEIDVLTIHEQRLLEAQLLDNPTITGLGILLSLNAGLRIGEVCALSWSDIDQDSNILSVTGTVVRIKKESGSGNLAIDVPKTSASLRKIPIPSKLHGVLAQMRNTSQGKYVLSEHCSFISPRTYEYRFHKVLDKCGIRSINYHVLRHTFATRCIELGMDIKTLSELLGHTNTSTTLNTYVHSSMDHKRAQIERLSTLLE